MNRLKFVIILSSVVHIFVICALIKISSSFKTQDKPKNYIVANILKLGKKRPDNLLPRKTKKKLLPIIRNKKKLKKDNKTSKKKIPIKKKKSPISKKKSPKKIITSSQEREMALKKLKHLTNFQEEGHEDGTQGGTTTNPTDTLIGRLYLTKIRRCIKKHYVAEGLNQDRVSKLTATVSLKVQNNGQLTHIKLEKKSDEDLFNRAVLRAVKRCKRVDPPPKDMQNILKNFGIKLPFRP